MGARQRERVGQGERRAEAVGDGRRPSAIACGRAGGEASMHAVGALGLDADHQALRGDLLDGDAHAGDQAAAADRHDDRLQIGQLADQLEAACGGAECRDRTLERVDRVAALALDDPLHRREQRVGVVDQHDLGALRLTARDAHRIGGLGHHDLGAYALAGGGPRDGERMIAGAHRRHAAPARLRIEPVDVQQRRARLEGARVLEQLELDRDPRALRQVRADTIRCQLRDRRRDDPSGQRLGCRLDLAKASAPHVPRQKSPRLPPLTLRASVRGLPIADKLRPRAAP